MQLNPARGRKLWILDELKIRLMAGLCSSTPRGDGNSTNHERNQLKLIKWFMQLNPARGRKPVAMPRDSGGYQMRFMQLNPARGRKQSLDGVTHIEDMGAVYAAQPREGTETMKLTTTLARLVAGLCSSTPRGDGNQTGPAYHACRDIQGLCSSTPRGDGN